VDVDELDYELPEELIAQAPLPERDASRLLLVDEGVAHHHVRELPALLPPALIVVNDTRVLPARLLGKKPSGGKAELLLVERLRSEAGAEVWRALGKASKGLRAGHAVLLDGLRAEVLRRDEGGTLEVRLEAPDVGAAIERLGAMPLPPYIAREVEPSDRERYQTVFAEEPGAVAAPTAGLHFSERLLAELDAAGHRLSRVTLHVGPGTFRPIKSSSLEEHPMHEERYEVPETTAAAIDEARREGRPVLAVGTTVTRTLEAAADGDRVRVGPGRTRLFIRPPYAPKVVDHLLTNFHLPRSTLLALVMALAGVSETRAAYAEAVRARYRFFSYGDAMLLRNLRR